jgi:hypothetical protein
MFAPILILPVLGFMIFFIDRKELKSRLELIFVLYLALAGREYSTIARGQRAVTNAGCMLQW